MFEISSHLPSLAKLTAIWKANSKFTIHPFKSLHSRHLLPLSLQDYFARFSLELIVLFVAILGFSANISVNHAVSDQSVIFSFLQMNPDLNRNLLANAQITTILANSDQQIFKSVRQSLGQISLADAHATTNIPPTDPTTIQGEVALKTNPADTENFSRHGLTTYTIIPGDTIGGIAGSFGISPATIMMQNKLDEYSILKVGAQLTILPTTGITYTLKEGDTFESILNKYKISEDDFLDANNVESFEDLEAGAVAVIPLESVTMPKTPKPVNSRFVSSDSGKVALKQASAPESLGGGPMSFIWPTSIRGITQGFSRRHGGLDISDSKMEPIYAAADGFVEISGYQTNGYGNTIVINHGSGLKTRYGHASDLYVQAGDYVKQGQIIAKQGRTGRVRGVTGIHLHFEIIKNGAKVNPLAYVKP